jgi:hypothetical protein
MKCRLLEDYILAPQINPQWYLNLFERAFSLSIVNLIIVKFRPRDLDSILGGGLYQSLTIFRMKDKYPTIINWVFTHLFIGFQYLSTNQIWYNNHGFWNFLKYMTWNFPKFHKKIWVNYFMKIICCLKLLK